MRFDEQHRPSWFEQGDEVYGHTLSPVERFLDELDNFPRTTRLTSLSAHRERTRPGANLPSSAPGHNLPEQAA